MLGRLNCDRWATDVNAGAISPSVFSVYPSIPGVPLQLSGIYRYLATDTALEWLRGWPISRLFH